MRFDSAEILADSASWRSFSEISLASRTYFAIDLDNSSLAIMLFERGFFSGSTLSWYFENGLRYEANCQSLILNFGAFIKISKSFSKNVPYGLEVATSSLIAKDLEWRLFLGIIIVSLKSWFLAYKNFISFEISVRFWFSVLFKSRSKIIFFDFSFCLKRVFPLFSHHDSNWWLMTSPNISYFSRSKSKSFGKRFLSFRSNSLLVYPASTAAINSLSTNVGYSHVTLATLQYIAISSTQWYTVGASYA